MIKGIIFDLDGTVLDTMLDIQKCLNQALQEFGFKEKSYDEVRMGVGTGFINLVRKVVDKDTSEETILELADRYKEIYSDNLTNNTKAFTGIENLLKELQNQNIKVAVNSNKSDKNTKKLIYKNFPDINFVAVYGLRENIKRKPDPEAANQIIELMNLDKSEVIYIGDSETDIQTGKNANIKTAACLWGYRDKETLEKENPDYLLDKPEKLLEIIQKEK